MALIVTQECVCVCVCVCLFVFVCLCVCVWGGVTGTWGNLRENEAAERSFQSTTVFFIWLFILLEIDERGTD